MKPKVTLAYLKSWDGSALYIEGKLVGHDNVLDAHAVLRILSQCGIVEYDQKTISENEMTPQDMPPNKLP